ncbi:MAG: tetratricopeptide repeat protein, partial [Actinomycetota bacterium]
MSLTEALRAWDLAKSVPTDGLHLADRLSTTDDDAAASAVALAAQGRAHFELGNNDQAIDDLRRAVDDVPVDFRPRVVTALAAALAAGGSTDEATGLLRRLVEDAEPLDDVVRGLALSQL